MNKTAQQVSQVKPLGDRLIVRPDDKEDLTPGGIVLPDQAQEKPDRGLVVAVGRGYRLQDGTIAEMEVQDGDRVIFSTYAAQEIEIGGVTHVMIREQDVAAIVE